MHKKWFFSGAWKALSLKNGNAILVQEVKEWREIKNETKNGYSKLYDSSGCAMRTCGIDRTVEIRGGGNRRYDPDDDLGHYYGNTVITDAVGEADTAVEKDHQQCGDQEGAVFAVTCTLSAGNYVRNQRGAADRNRTEGGTGADPSGSRQYDDDADRPASWTFDRTWAKRGRRNLLSVP